MISKFKRLFLPVFFMAVFLPYNNIFADTGPKPTMEFEFIQARNLTITSGILYECDQPDCSDAEPLKELGPQGLRCDAVGCNALAYGFAPYHRLEVEFSDGNTRASNIFKTAGFNSKYKVTVRENDLLVESKFTLSATAIILLSCVCISLGGAFIVALIVFAARRLAKK